MRPCVCPNCNAQISLDESRDFGFCQYCGTKIILDDYRSTHRVIDEARIKETETDRIIRLKELELEEKENAKVRKGRMISYGIALIFVAIGSIVELFDPYNLFGIFLIIGGAWIALFTLITADSQNKKLEDARNARRGMIKLSNSAMSYVDKNFRAIEGIYRQLGFQTINTINLKDLRVGLFKKPGSVETVTIDGERPNEQKWYNPNATVVISYHGIANE